MFGAGLLLGWKGAILAFFVGCILGSVIHLIRMAAVMQSIVWHWDHICLQEFGLWHCGGSI